MLIEYDPVVPLDPKQVISHTYEASGLCAAADVERDADVDLRVRLPRSAVLQRRRRC